MVDRSTCGDGLYQFWLVSPREPHVHVRALVLLMMHLRRAAAVQQSGTRELCNSRWESENRIVDGGSRIVDWKGKIRGRSAFSSHWSTPTSGACCLLSRYGDETTRRANQKPRTIHGLAVVRSCPSIRPWLSCVIVTPRRRLLRAM